MKKIWAVRKDAEAVSPVIATILMVAITVVLAAVLYVMVLGFGGGGQSTPQATYSISTITNGKKITILSLTADNVPWDDVTIVLKDTGTGSKSWLPMKEDLNNNAGNSMNYSTGTGSMGALVIDLWAIDNIGNGIVDGGDYITIFTVGTGFTSGMTYTVQFLYEPTGDQIGNPVSWTA